MAGHQLIDDHLAVLAHRLPADAVDELADGLMETWQHRCDAGLPPDQAAHAAVAEFGTPEQITRAFVAQAPGRRTARLLLATGPVVGACWGASLIAAHVWAWPVPGTVAALFGLALVGVVAALLASATARHSYRRTRLGTAGGLGLVALDAAVITMALVVAPTLAWPVAVAISASLARIGLTLCHLPATLSLADGRPQPPHRASRSSTTRRCHTGPR